MLNTYLYTWYYILTAIVIHILLYLKHVSNAQKLLGQKEKSI
jgi:glycerol-3-phosphate acyltransferase PlsY